MNPRLEKLLSLPRYQRILILCGVLVLIAAGFLYFMYLPQKKELATLQKKNHTLEAKLREDQRIANNLPKFKAEYEKMKLQLDEALKELPNEKEIPTLLSSIASLAKDNGLDILRFRPGKESTKGFYAEVPVELKLTGTYHQVGKFFYDVGNLSRIVNISNVSLSPKPENDEMTLAVDCLATTFRFVDQPADTPANKKKGGKR